MGSRAGARASGGRAENGRLPHRRWRTSSTTTMPTLRRSRQSERRARRSARSCRISVHAPGGCSSSIRSHPTR
ncbi:MAG: hypothetical protein EA388_14560 [Nitriliruptor sp.]|nr:MAG: hypothetical protein EA388_14560 [Nitriliruptor sp.]